MRRISWLHCMVAFASAHLLLLRLVPLRGSSTGRGAWRCARWRVRAGGWVEQSAEKMSSGRYENVAPPEGRAACGGSSNGSGGGRRSVRHRWWWG